MKTITLNIDDEIFNKLKSDAALLSFVEGCVSVSLMEQIMTRVIIKIENGEKEMSILKKE
jgi:hypothetical protein